MPDLADYQWLIGDEAAKWLDKVAVDLAGTPPRPAFIRSLRTSLNAARASLVLEQVELRAKGKEKFSLADQLFFTRRGLEQATDEHLAAYKSQRFADSLSIADLCCGIGGDAMPLGREHALALVDRDEISLSLAAANVERCGGLPMQAIAAGVSPTQVAEIDAWHIDPDRRASGRRTSQVELGEPGVEVIDSLRVSCSNAAVKLAPAANVPEHWADACEREWIETRNECRQQVAWFGSLASAPFQHVATIVEDNGEACSFSGPADVATASADAVRPFLFDPSPSLVAAHLVGALAEALELRSLSTQSLYLTGDSEIVHPHLQGFAVDDVLPFDVRKLRTHMQARQIGTLEIKKRGIDVTPESLRPQLGLAGDNAATLILSPVGEHVRALICRRVG